LWKHSKKGQTPEKFGRWLWKAGILVFLEIDRYLGKTLTPEILKDFLVPTSLWPFEHCSKKS
jgi:hypothetical protein